MKKYSFVLILPLLLNSCVSVEQTEEKKEKTNSKIETIAHSKFDENYAIKLNESGSHSIVFTKVKKLKDLFATVQFFIFEEESQSIIFEDELNAGNVYWTSNEEVQAISRNSTDKTNENQSTTVVYLYNVKSKVKSYKK